MEAVVSVAIAALTGLGVVHARQLSRIHELDRRADAIEVKMAEKYVSKECFETVFQIQRDNTNRLSEKLDDQIESIKLRFTRR